MDASPRMVEHAKERLGDSVDIRIHDLRDPLDFLEDASIDIVVSPLVMDYIENWVPVFREFHRILVGDGVFVFSMEHPFTKSLWHQSENYLATERVEMWWGGFGVRILMPSFRRPLEAVIEPLFESGFLVEKILEPKPTPKYREVDPEGYEKLLKTPSFMCIRAKKW